jgi:hypothetical protein
MGPTRLVDEYGSRNICEQTYWFVVIPKINEIQTLSGVDESLTLLKQRSDDTRVCLLACSSRTNTIPTEDGDTASFIGHPAGLAIKRLRSMPIAK